MNKFDGMAPRPALAGVPNAKQLGVQRLRARRRRVAVMRKRLLGVATATFLALWAVIFGQLVAGSDPALSQSTGHKAAATTTATTSNATSSSTPSAPTASTSTSVSATPVTTSQS